MVTSHIQQIIDHKTDNLKLCINLKKTELKSHPMALQVTELAAQSEDLSPFPETHTKIEVAAPQSCTLTSTCNLWHAWAQKYTHT